jgi:hypothetical protein
MAATAITVAAATAYGQTNLSTAVKPAQRQGRIVVSDQQATDLGLNVGITPTTVDRRNLSEAVKLRLERFELSREAYLREQEQLKKRLNGAATEAERERVRALIRDRRDDWLRRMRELRAQSKDRILELRRQLPSKGEVLDAARQNAREAIQDIRKRRGQD